VVYAAALLVGGNGTGYGGGVRGLPGRPARPGDPDPLERAAWPVCRVMPGDAADRLQRRASACPPTLPGPGAGALRCRSHRPRPGRDTGYARTVRAPRGTGTATATCATVRGWPPLSPGRSDDGANGSSAAKWRRMPPGSGRSRTRITTALRPV